MKTNSKQFTFSWRALNLLGKSLYTNAWNAIAELVANGLDAKANIVRVLIDARSKEASRIEIMDDGRGMGEEDIDAYVKVGYDKRLVHNSKPDSDYDGTILGRKGIGKLAALFLTRKYYLQTKTADGVTTWLLDGSNLDDLDQIPELIPVEESSISAVTPEWESVDQGTIIIMEGVDLKGLGEKAFNALSAKLANQFLLDSMPNKSIQLSVQQAEDDVVHFTEVAKSVAFKNMAIIAPHYSDGSLEPKAIRAIRENAVTVAMPYTRNKSKEYIKKVKVRDLSFYASDEYPLEGFYLAGKSAIVDKALLAKRHDVAVSEEGIKIPYEITGWVGLHATIAEKAGQKNDDAFRKNRFYNPSQIRLYVRNKLASDDLLGKLGITHAFANYVEGEISFDLLDDDLLSDIATSNRQGFDELDDRWEVLRNTIRPIVTAFISERGKIAKELQDAEDEDAARTQATAKETAIANISQGLDGNENIPTEEKEGILNLFSMQHKGDVGVEAKENYIVFISHSSEDKIFTDFVYRLLLARGATEEDFFYTSDKGNPKLYSIEPLAEQIKRNIVSDNTRVAFFASPYFLSSPYCLFEGGAAWATKSVEDYNIFATVHDGIPPYLSNDKLEIVLSKGDPIRLTAETYNKTAIFLNALISHINKGHIIRGEQTLSEFRVNAIPDEVVLEREGKTERDYMDSTFLEYWNVYVERKLDGYVLRPKNAEDTESVSGEDSEQPDEA